VAVPAAVPVVCVARLVYSSSKQPDANKGTWTEDNHHFLNFGNRCPRPAGQDDPNTLCKKHAADLNTSGRLIHGLYDDEIFTPNTTTHVFDTLLKSTTITDAQRASIHLKCHPETLQELLRRQTDARARKQAKLAAEAATAEAATAAEAAAAQAATAQAAAAQAATAAVTASSSLPPALNLLKAKVKNIKIAGNMYIYDLEQPTAKDLTVPVHVFNCKSGNYVGTFDRSQSAWLSLLSSCDPRPPLVGYDGNDTDGTED
jgi:hypothetical protein